MVEPTKPGRLQVAEHSFKETKRGRLSFPCNNCNLHQKQSCCMEVFRRFFLGLLVLSGATDSFHLGVPVPFGCRDRQALSLNQQHQCLGFIHRFPKIERSCELNARIGGGSFDNDDLKGDVPGAIDRKVSFSSNGKLSQPISSRSVIERSDAGSLIIKIPAKGMGSDSFFSGAFSLAWFSAIIPATFAAPGSALFLLPFWAAGGLVAKNVVYDPFLSSRLTIGEFGWSLEKLYAGKGVVGKEEGATEDLRGAGEEPELLVVVNGVPQYALKLYVRGRNVIEFGNGLSYEELAYLAQEINQSLEDFREKGKEGESS